MTQMRYWPWMHFFDWEHILTPIAGDVRMYPRTKHVTQKVRVIYIFGIRVAHWVL